MDIDAKVGLKSVLQTNDLRATSVIEKARRPIFLVVVCNLIGTILSITFLVLVCHFTIFPWESRPITSPLESRWGLWSALILLEAIVVTAITGSFTLIFVRFLLSPRPGVAIDSDGFEYWKYAIKIERICWDDIERIELKQDRITKFLLGSAFPNLFRFVTIYLREGAAPRKTVGGLSRRLGMGDVSIDHRYLAFNAFEIHNLLSSYLAVTTKSENRFSNYPRP